MLDRSRLTADAVRQRAIFCNLDDADLAAHALNVLLQLEIGGGLEGLREHFFQGMVHELANRLLERGCGFNAEPALIQELLELGAGDQLVNIDAGREAERTQMRQRLLPLDDATLVDGVRFQSRRVQRTADPAETLLVDTIVPEMVRRMRETRVSAA